MSWYRMEYSLDRFSVVGTNVRTATFLEHLLADEHNQELDSQKVYIATTVGNECCLGAETAEAAESDKLKVAYQVFKDKACNVSPKYAPKTVSTDSWKGTQAAWKMLFTKVVILLCFLHASSRSANEPNTLKRCLPKSPGGFGIPITPPTAGVLHNACLAPPVSGRTPHRDRPGEGLGPVRQARLLVDCLPPPRGHRTSNMLDRLMRGMNRYFDQSQHLHSSLEACRLHCRA